jgi:hypothetical protein
VYAVCPADCLKQHIPWRDAQGGQSHEVCVPALSLDTNTLLNFYAVRKAIKSDGTLLHWFAMVLNYYFV